MYTQKFHVYCLNYILKNQSKRFSDDDGDRMIRLNVLILFLLYIHQLYNNEVQMIFYDV